MDATMTNFVNFGFIWLIVALSIAGYMITIKRTGQRWSLWILLATGWALLAIPYTLLLIGIPIGVSEISAIWLSSYLLVMTSLLLLFLKLISMVRHRAKQ